MSKQLEQRVRLLESLLLELAEAIVRQNHPLSDLPVVQVARTITTELDIDE